MITLSYMLTVTAPPASYRKRSRKDKPMNFVNGKIVTEEECRQVLENIDDMILSTLQKPPLDINLVIEACDALAKNITNLDIIQKLPELGLHPRLMEIYLNQVEQMFSAQAIRQRLETELGPYYDKQKTITYTYSKATARQFYAPQGVLFHITAGNVDVLPFMSLLEGLICGNINIIKLPKEDMGITAGLLQELINLQPAIKEYAYIFDYSSRDIYAMRKLADVADAIVVWGGDEAVKAVRTLATPNTKIIEWGHKISFAYATPSGISKAALEKLAQGICLTNQVFCSSCQGVFLDTEDMQEVYDFCQEFLPVLERVAKEYHHGEHPVGAVSNRPPSQEQPSTNRPYNEAAASALFTQARVTLELYHQEIATRGTATRIFKGENCSVTAQPDSKLEPSIMYKNIWVKPLTKDKLPALRRYKNYLQTTALLCSQDEYGELSQALLRAGVVKVSDGFEMSNYAVGEAHDGVFPLRGYTRLVSVQDV